MALVECDECGHKISDNARACPRCGCQFEQPKNPLVVIIVAITGLILGPFLLWVFVEFVIGRR